MRIVIAEGSAVLRAGLAHVLAERGHQVEAVGDAGALGALAGTHRPDVLIANAALPSARTDDGIRAVLAAGHRWPRGGLLVYSESPEPRYAARLFAGSGTRSGVGYLLQERIHDARLLLEAVAGVAAGGTVVDPRIVGSLATGDTAGGTGGELGVLSGRELEVLELMAQGRTNSAIAQQLNVSPGTVEKRAAAVFGKLGIPCTGHDNRRVLAVLRYLGAQPGAVSGHEPRMTLARVA
ncbi:response regulator transcription factor [Streptomyces sp. NBC_00388]|uniref:response regulator transcription factor n=1 Tax=Streptomyces sp. NBC_00388 TaxID=2975735 RepID=UPI002E1D6F51